MGSRPQHVTVVGINYSPEETGIAPYTSGLCRGLVRRGFEVSVISAQPHYPQWRVADGFGAWTSRELLDGVHVTRVRHYVPSRPTGVYRALSELSFGVRASSTRWRQPEVVLCVSPALLSTSLAVARATGGTSRPAVGVVIQDLYSAGVEEQGGSDRLARAFGGVESWVARRADGVAVIHERFRERVVYSLNVPAERVAVVRNWTHLLEPAAVDRAAMRRSLGWHEHETVVLHTGAMGQKQDLANVVDAARLAERRGEPLRFVLMGDGGQRRHLEDIGGSLSNLQFVDPLPGAAYAQALRSADILLVSEKAGLKEMAVPSKLTSYFSTGLPVLAATADDSTTADEIRASGAGVVVGAGDPEALIVATRDLRQSPSRARDIGARGPAYCAKVLSETAAMDGYERWVLELYDRKMTAKGRA